MATSPSIESASSWPPLTLDEWRETYATLHLWTQIVGKTRLALAPMQNHWWQVAFYITTQGFGTSPMPYGARTVEIDFDFIDHALIVRTSDGDVRSLPLVPQSVADFYQAYLDLLESLDVDVHIDPTPTEMAEVIRFTDDRVHAAYDRDAAHRCWQVLVQADRVLKEFRAQFLGKCSPVHFWWGGFDLACTRFSGRRAPPHPGGIPHLSDAVTREAYSHECISAGWWPGGGLAPDAAFYAYSYPEPAGCAAATIRPTDAYYHPEMREWLLPYAAVRASPDPDAMLTEFLASTYQVAADLGHWDRKALER